MRDHGDVAPSVIGADYVAEANGEEPEPAFVPLEQRLLSQDKDATVELRRLEDGRLAVLAYTSLEALVHSCGDLQPWASLPADKVAEIQQRSGADLVLWDAELPADQRRDAGGN
ncbi:hypothetical protein MOQ72_39230 [Saccharopolyspora sp. K220]|nr:hypothetical protein [Saccharopolyspora soli]